MEYIKAYIYDTEIEANQVLSIINSSLGIPKNIDSITITYTVYEFNNLKYIIKHDKTIESILGQPKDFEYIQEVNPF